MKVKFEFSKCMDIKPAILCHPYVPPPSAANSSVDSEYRSGGEERDLPPRKKVKTVEEGIMGEFSLCVCVCVCVCMRVCVCVL